MGSISFIGWSRYRYALIVTDEYLRSRWVKNQHEKREAGLALKRFVMLIDSQTDKIFEPIRLNQGRKFRVQDLEFWTQEKGIKIEYTVAYFLEMNGIAERTNGLIAGQAICLLLDKGPWIKRCFWPKLFWREYTFLTGLSLLFYNSTGH